MDYLIYLCYRACIALLSALPLIVVYRLGQLAGGVGYMLLAPYRRLAAANLRIAFGPEKSAGELRHLTWAHFVHLGANLLSAVKAAGMDVEQLRKVTAVEGMPIIQGALDRGRGVVLVISHIGNWELFAQLCQFLPQYRWSTVYQPLGNRYIEAHVQRTRTQHGVVLFSRKNGFNGPTAFLRAGGAVGVLVDQHAGDGGGWVPLFDRLASTSNLAALLALRTGAELVPMAVQTAGAAHWRVVISPPISATATDGSPRDASALTAEINQVLELQIRASPPDWFWVHNRWKTPRPKFLLATYRRAIGRTPPGSPRPLQPFRILVRSTNWLGDAVMTIPAVQAIARGRPDVEITVLGPAKLAELWLAVPGVHGVLGIEAGDSVFAVARAVRGQDPFDVAVILPNSLRSALEVWLAGVPRRVAFAGHSRRWLLNQVVPEPPAPPLFQGAENERPGKPPHQALRYAYIALHSGAEAVAEYGEPPPPDETDAGPLPERGGWARIGLCPGAEYGPTKRWFPESFADAAQAVSSRAAAEWMLFGVAKDAAAGAIIEQALPGRCQNMIGKTSLAELIVQLRRCHLLLTNDTGTMHLAAWLGVPVVAIFGSTDPILTGPVAPPARVRIMRHQVVCSPCFLRECPLDLRCLKAVTADEVGAAVLAALDAAVRR